MASIKIHQDIFNFERRRKGFTMRQLIGIGLSAVLIIAVTAFLVYVLVVPWNISIALGTIFGLIPALIGFVPLFNMPAEEFIKRTYDQQKRGRCVLLESTQIDIEKGGESRVQIKDSKKRGYECRH